MDPSWDVFFTCHHDSSNGLVDIFIDNKPPRSLLRLGHEIRLGQTGKKKTAQQWCGKFIGKQPFSKPLNILKGVGAKNLWDDILRVRVCKYSMYYSIFCWRGKDCIHEKGGEIDCICIISQLKQKSRVVPARTRFLVKIKTSGRCKTTKLAGGFNFFYFHPYLGMISNLTNIFQIGWNHQLEKLYLF